MCKLDVRVGDGVIGLRELLETNDRDVPRSVGPRVVFDKLATYTVCNFSVLVSVAEGEAYASYSSSLKILWESLSTKISNPASISFVAVVGVMAVRRSNSFFSQRSHSWGAMIVNEGVLRSREWFSVFKMSSSLQSQSDSVDQNHVEIRLDRLHGVSRFVSNGAQPDSLHRNHT